jgi:hypothetical protein
MPGDPNSNTPTDPAATGQCVSTTSYAGYDGIVLEADRADGVANTNRSRVKPYAVLKDEYTRVLGAAPPLMATMASTFGAPPDRWSIEAEASGVTLFSSYRVAFQGCLAATATAANFAAAPTAATAGTECTAWATKMWSKTPSAAEVAPCVQVAVTDSATDTDARRRWSYACASVLSSSPFLTF